MNAEFVNSREHGTMNLGPVKCGEARYEAGWKTSWRKIAWEIAESKDLQDVSMIFYEMFLTACCWRPSQASDGRGAGNRGPPV